MPVDYSTKSKSESDAGFWKSTQVCPQLRWVLTSLSHQNSHLLYNCVYMQISGRFSWSQGYYGWVLSTLECQRGGHEDQKSDEAGNHRSSLALRGNEQSWQYNSEIRQKQHK